MVTTTAPTAAGRPHRRARSPPRTTGGPSTSAPSATRCGGPSPVPPRAAAAPWCAAAPTAARASRCCPPRGTCAAASSSTAACPGPGAERPTGGPLVVFVHFADQRLYAYEPDAPGEPRRARSPRSSRASAAGCAGPTRCCRRTAGEVWCVLEEFTGEGPTDVRRVLAAVPLDGSAAEDRGRGARTHRRPAPVRHRAAALPGRAARRLDRLGPPAGCPGTAPSVTARRGHRATARSQRRPDRRRRPRGVGRPGRLGARRRLLLASATAAAGGTSTASTSTRTARRADRPVPARGGVRAGRCGSIGQRWFAPAGRTG